MANNEESWKMKWQKDFETFFPIYNTFVLEGFIDDDQPYLDGDTVSYCRLHDYFDKIYSKHEDSELKKRVIIYDPTESLEKRFRICDDGDPIEEPDPNNPNGKPRVCMDYDSKMSQHFWDILHSEELDKLLIDHRSSGASLDFSKIQYAVTERNGRINQFDIRQFDILRRFEESIWNLLFGANEPSGYLFVIRMTSRLLSRQGSSNGLSGEELMYFRQLLNIAQSLESNQGDGNVKKHKLVILANQVGDLPSWFTDERANPFIKVLNVSKPSEDNKISYFHEMLNDADCLGGEFAQRYRAISEAYRRDNPEAKRDPVEKKFLAYTNDFSLKALRRYRAFAAQSGLTDPDKLGYSISSFSVGDMTNPWDDDGIIKEMLNIKAKVGKKIQGQDHALGSAQSIMARAALGLDRAENPNAPRVVLFLAGPTGTGKTELCKQLAECVFGSEDRIVRFDMSEYGEDHADQKLFGAPPGYVGYEEGGKLTNAVKKEPFSLILFDEIEKAANSILDKFLQILGDGRLTDGKGETVRFTDCIIAITSNAGVTAPAKNNPFESEENDKELMGEETTPERMDMAGVKRMEEEGKSEDEIYAAVREHLRYNVKRYFHCKLKRPELYGRIEDSIVYYNFIGKKAVPKIVDSKIDSVIKSAKESNGIANIICPDSVRAAITRYCEDTKVRELGARGIIKNTGKLFSGSLSKHLTPYVLGVNGKSKAQLRGATITCSCNGEITGPDDIIWS